MTGGGWRRTKRNITRNFLPAKQEYDDVQRDGSAGRLTEARWKGSGARKGGFGAAKIANNLNFFSHISFLTFY